MLARPEGTQARCSASPASPTTGWRWPGARCAECLAEELRRLDPDVHLLTRSPARSSTLTGGPRREAGRSRPGSRRDAPSRGRPLRPPRWWPRPRPLSSPGWSTRRPPGRRPRRAHRRRHRDRRCSRQLADSPARDAVDWSRLHVWWGDERFLPAGRPRPQRDPGARGAARPRPRRPGRHVHADAARGRPDRRRPRAAAAAYADELAAAPPRPEDHGAGAALRRAAARDGPGRRTSRRCSPSTRRCTTTSATVVGGPRGAEAAADPAVADLAGDPRRRARCGSLVAGEDKAAAVAMALRRGRASTRSPRPAPTGSRRTLWLLDRAARAAARRPTGLLPDRGVASPVRPGPSVDARLRR